MRIIDLSEGQEKELPAAAGGLFSAPTHKSNTDMAYLQGAPTGIYLDHAATTPLSPRAREAMLPWLESQPFNPSSPNRPGRVARAALERARSRVADCLGAASPDEVIFTASGTEANNLALFGLARAYLKPGDLVQVGATEHKSALLACQELARQGLRVQVLQPDRQGRIVPLLDEKPRLLCLMLANNEIGTVAPMAEIAAACLENGTLLCCDAICAAGKLPVRVDQPGVSTLSLAAHKFYGPTGVGMLFVRQGLTLEPLLHGGTQERALRPGTQNLPGIVAASEALDEATGRMSEESARLTALADDLWQSLREQAPELVRNGDPLQRLPGLLHLSFPGIHSEALLLELDLAGLYASSGSACSAGESGPSHVVRALGLPPELRRGSLRLSFGRCNQPGDLPRIGAIVLGAYRRLAKLSSG